MIYTIVAVEGMEKVESKTKEVAYGSKVDDESSIFEKNEKNLEEHYEGSAVKVDRYPTRLKKSMNTFAQLAEYRRK